VGRVAYRYPAKRLPAEGFYVGPAIVTGVSAQDPLAQEELFGPLLCVFRVRDLEEGLVLANGTDYALTGGIYSRSPANIQRALQQLDVGNLYVNRPITGAMVGRQPFGGHRLSGQGTKAGGPEYLLQCLLPQTIATDTTRHGMPLE
jgi:RHH-type proline utilization regulon transcriptional repressor/proline dehydrogenase/delta 1-pyrroline-5-carboxylate dehydrogenase